MKDTKNAGYKAPAFDRIAVLQGQLLQVREKIRRAEYEHSRKAGGPSDSDEQDLCELETRERNILDKIADAKQQLEREEIDDSINIGYRCDRCEKIIEVNETHYHSLSLEDLDYDLCETCYQSSSDKEKKLYSDNTVDPLTQFVKVVAKAKSVCEALVKASEQFADWPCLGYRVMENGIAQDRFSWLRHKELHQIALFLGAGIRQFLYHGLKDEARVFVGVSGINSLDWIVSDIAVSLQSMVLVPIHTSLDEEGISHIINTSCVSCVLCSPEMFPKLTTSKKNCPSLKLIVQFNSWPYDPTEEGRVHMKALQSFLQTLRSSEKDLSPVKNVAKLIKNLKLDEGITSFIQKFVKDSNLQHQLVVLFNQHITISHTNGIFQYFIPSKDRSPSVTQSLISCHMNTVLVLSCVYHCYIMGCLPQPVTSGPDDIVSVIYTSGSTGFAKGVPFTNRGCLKLTLDYNSDPEIMVCKDALAHASERETVFSTIIQAGRVGIMTNTTLLMEDIRLLSPTYLSTTPRFFNRLYSEYQKLFEVKKLQLEADNPEYEEILLELQRKEILASFKSMFGGRLKKVIVGGAATSRDVFEFMRELFNESFVIEGYGCTEVGNIATMRRDGVATLYGGVQFQLESVPTLNYHVKDPTYPRMGDKGELLVKTEVMCQGYYNNDTQTASTFTDGWFHTGDIVEMVGDKNFIIIDRIKNFFKLSQGEFVSSEKLENIYLSSVFVDQVYITCADTKRYEQKAVFAVVIPRIDYLKDRVSEQGLEVATCDNSTLCNLNEAIKLVHNDLVRVGKGKKLRGFEIPYSVLLDSEPFTVDNGCLTSSQKIARMMLQKKYQERVNQCVSKLTQHKEPYLPDTNVYSLIAETLGLETDATSGLSSKTFSEHGGDSLTAMRFTAVAKELFGVDVSVDALLSSDMSLDRLTNMISSHRDVVTGDKDVLDLMRQDINMKLPTFNSGLKVCSTNNIFLTGSTGFLGCFLLSSLLTHYKESKIFCLLRCNQESEGIEKLTKCFKAYDLPIDQLEERIIVVCGDLEKERFGLDSSSFCSLGESVSLIYHLGAHVNHVLGYEALRGPNVLGTVHVIELAASHNIPLHHVSSISVADSVLGSPIHEVPLQPLSLHSMGNAGGYTQTKWVSEYLVWRASQHKLSIAIYRPGMISWSTESGRGNKKDWFYRLVQGVMELGSAPGPTRATIALTPVDFLAQNICHISQCVADMQDAWGKIFHFENPNKISFKGIFSWIDKFYSINKQEPLEILSQKEWWSKVHAEINASQSCIHEKYHKERLDKLSGLLLFADGVPTDSLCYSYRLDNSTKIGKVEFPSITDESFIKFISTEFK